MTLTSAELTQMRAAVTDMLPDTCNILTDTRTSDGQGGWTNAAGTASAGVACRLDKETGNETIAGGAIQSFSRWMLTLPYGTTIATTNKVEVGSTTYAVKSVDGSKSWALDVRVELEQI